MLLRRVYATVFFAFALFHCVAQTANGHLQIHHIDMGQGDSAVLISPQGSVVMFDIGRDMAKRKDCSAEIDYLDQLGVKQIDYLFVSHYHYDHIECVPEVLEKFPLKGPSYDRGTDQTVPNTATYRNYVAAVGTHRKTATVGQLLTLDSGSDPVTLRVLSASGHYDGGTVQTVDENDLSVSVLISYGKFREEIGGDLSGEETSMYQDVETPVSKSVGPLDVYKVHHHCSSHSSNMQWLQATQPTIAIISTGDGNSYRHPTDDCLERLHEAEISRVFWTEDGNGGSPRVNDVIAGDVSIDVPPQPTNYSVTYGSNITETFNVKDGSENETRSSDTPVAATATKANYAWSVRADHYYDIDCYVVNRISPKNLQTSATAPTDKRYAACPNRRSP